MRDVFRKYGGASADIEDLDARAWSAIPVTWFAALGLAGQSGRPPLDPLLALPVLLASLGFIALGLRSLTQGYMTRVSTMMRVKSRGANRGPSRALVARLPLPGGQATRAGATFVGTMALRDWQFRRMVLGGSVGVVILFGVGIGRRFALSPLAPEAVVGPLPFLPLMLGILMLNASMALAFTDRPQARWIFNLVPARGLRGMVRGMYWGLWRSLIALPHIVLGIAGVVFWGVRDAVLFWTYSLAVTPLYLGAGLWLANGLPFTKPADPSRQRALMGVMLIYLASAVALGFLQRLFLFRHLWFIPAATGLLGLAAWLAAAASFRTLEARILQSITSESEGRRMFEQVEEPES